MREGGGGEQRPFGFFSANLSVLVPPLIPETVTTTRAPAVLKNEKEV